MDPIKVENETTCVCFHPFKSLLTAGNIEGQIKIYAYGDDKVREIMSFDTHKKSVRSLGFLAEGIQLVAVSADKSFSVTNIDTGKLEFRMKKAHEASIYSLAVVGRNMFATGDDDGCVKLWDMRQKNKVMEMSESSETITDMLVDPQKKILLATSGEGTLSAFDLRKQKLKIQSELLDTGLQSLAIVKNGAKVVCGGEDGVLHFFNWGEFGNISDRYPGHPMSIEKIVTLPNGMILTAASDAIRAVNVFPNKVVDIVGDHGGLPVEGLALSNCGSILASCSHDEHIRFWDVSDLENEHAGKSVKARASKKKYIPKVEVMKREKFFNDLVDDMNAVDEENVEEGTSKESSDEGDSQKDKTENDSSDDDSDDGDDDNDDEESDDDSDSDDD